jgi:hypothetical protein
MTRADRVLSTPATNTPIDPNRRRFLAVAAGAHCEAIEAQEEAEKRNGFRSIEQWDATENCEAACCAANAIDWKLANTPPTTLAGVAAVLRFANGIEDAGGEWSDTDTIGRDGWHYQLRATMAASIEALMKAQAGKAVLP